MSVTLKQLFESKVHLGHLARFREPKMADFIFCTKNKMNVIDLDKTQSYLKEALEFLKMIAARKGSKILFVGTKRIAQPFIKEEAIRCGMPYVDRYWRGGTLTNYRNTTRDSVKRLKDMEAMQAQGTLELATKKEVRNFERRKAHLEKGVGGLKEMVGLPDALFVIDVGYEKIAISEAKKLKIPIVGIVDTNHSPDGIDYVIPGNDDAKAAVELYAKLAADVILEGRQSIAEVAEEVSTSRPMITTVKKPSMQSDNIDDNKPAQKTEESQSANSERVGEASE